MVEAEGIEPPVLFENRFTVCRNQPTVALLPEKWLQRSDLNWWFPTYEDGDVATGLRCKMVCSTGLEPVSFALQASAMTSSAKNTWWSIRESNSFTISLQKKSAAHSYTPNRMEPNIRVKRMTYCLQGSCSIAELIGHGRGSRTWTYKTTVKV